ncbi:MAG: indolepyruvate ferredoxin oxidoreductase subunit alpha [Oscillospiraceae bacterium]|nr:indolepyruvate ferredoxin oxidoreductase subunit alpha [Candidatus Ruminococcus equi]
MKKLLIGNAAIARGLYEGGCSLISSYPGTPSTEITEEFAKFSDTYCEWAPNEKVAMETAFGAALQGKRSACCMKHVGLNVAADPLFTMSYTGVNAGLVICVADDPGMHSSQNEQDSRHYAIASKIPMLEPSDSEECLEFAKLAFEISENFDTPVFIKTCTRVAHSQSIVEIGERTEVTKEYAKNGAKYIMMPGNAIKRHPFVEERTKALTEYADTSGINRIEKADNAEFGIITSSTSYQYVKEVFGDSVSVLKLGMVNPLPINLIKDFAKLVNKIYVVEELDPIIENHCKSIGVDVIGREVFSILGEFSQKSIAKAFNIQDKYSVDLDTQIPVRPPMMCAGCPHRGMYYVLARNKVTVLGDIGCYTLGAQPPLCALDSTLCMGASVSSIHGFNKAGGTETEQKTVCVIGDSTFMHSGVTGLINIAYNMSNSTVIILDNSITGMTGHQQNPTTGYSIKGDPAGKINLEDLCHSVGINSVRVVDPYNLDECEKVLKEELNKNEPSVIISRRPCVLLKYVKPKTPLKVNTDKCKGCKKCMKFGCPAISFKDGHAKVDTTLCIGCEVCKQLCAFDAFESEVK